jgi:hypothetical protein
MLAENRNEEELEQLDIELGMVDSPEEIALAELKRYQEETGMTFEDPDAPVAPSGNDWGEPL